MTKSYQPAAGLPLTELATLRLRPHEERRLLAGHLWVYSNEVDIEATPLAGFTPGQFVMVRSHRDRFMGYAYVNPHTLIAARLLSRDPAHPPGQPLIVHRIKVALALRERLLAVDHYRLVHGEGDLLPGLVIDRYGALCVAQANTAGMEAMKPWVTEALKRVLGTEVLLWRNDSVSRELEGLPSQVETGLGEVPADITLEEGGVRFRVPLLAGQKTGWFFDQRANRAAFARLASGRSVLDVCCYLGGFGLQAARAGAAAVTCVDASANALAAVRSSAEGNGLAVETLESDAFEALAAMQAEGRRFDMIVLDPPAFIKRRKDLGRGLAAYRKLNQLALRLLARDGLLMSCSCSMHLEEAALLDAVQRGARSMGRHAQALSFGGQDLDHPVHPAIVESRYLKSILFRVTGE